jgi:hypothetical protein
MIARTSTAMLALVGGLLLAQDVVAQNYVYPAKGQSAEQQKTDEAQCSAWATQQTGVDPSQPAPTVATAGGGGEVVRGGAGGAALGAIGGAIAGNAGKGAAIGAAVGAARGLFQRFGQAREQSEMQSQVDTQHQAALQNYNRARNACLTGRGYTVN